jgi:hypothetical protein
MKPRLYLAGPMTGYPELNFPAFVAMASKLRAAGFEVISPNEINEVPGMTWADAMRKDIPALCTCQGIATLPGWRDSRGASLEVQIGRALAMEVRPAVAWLAETRAEVTA